MRLLSLEENEYLYQLKSKAPGETIASFPKEYESIVNEWNRSIELGISADLSALTDKNRDFEVFNHICFIDKFRLAYLDSHYHGREKLLAHLGCAIFYLDGLFCAFNKGGDPALLEELKEKGIRIGTCFAEHSVGRFAANIAPEYPYAAVIRIGEENYPKIFSDYVCFAQYSDEDGRSRVLLLFAPLSKYNETLHETIMYLLESENTSHLVFYPFDRTRYELFSSYLSLSEEMFILTDTVGRVFYISEAYTKEFGTTIERGQEPNLLSFLPEAAFFLEHGKTDAGTSPRKILLHNKEGKSASYVATYSPLLDPGGVLGRKIVFQHTYKYSGVSSGGKSGPAIFTFDNIIGESAALQQAKDIAMKAARNTSNLLITGESGTGKELFAHAVHNASPRRAGPFVPINCAAIPKELIGSELFGYEEGAFTGARREGYAGKFEQANNGTIFLDEIGDMPFEMQSVLLRVLEDNVVTRIGGKKSVPLDVRVITATNKNLRECVDKGTFRLDLYFRLNIFTLRIPPLREHSEDVPTLVSYYLSKLTSAASPTAHTFSPRAMELLTSYNWPGNIRELRNAVEQCSGSAEELEIPDTSLPPDIINYANRAGGSGLGEGLASVSAIPNYRDFSEHRIRTLMLECGGNKSIVAQRLGISRSTLYRRLTEIGYDLK